MSAVRILVFALAACGAAPKQRPPVRDAPEQAVPIATVQAPAKSPPGFAASDLVVIRGGDLTTWSIAGDKLTQLGSMKLETIADADAEEAMMMSVGQGDWADRDHLFVRLSDRQVVMITATAVAPLPVPAVSSLAVPRPDDADPNDEQVTELGLLDEGLQVTATGEAIWSHCAWGNAVDGLACSTWVHAGLWPQANRVMSKRPVTPRAWSWSAPPTGVTAVWSKKTVTCTAGASKTSIKTAGEEQIDSVRWASTVPPRMVIAYSDDSLHERFTLHDGCNAVPLVTGARAKPGPDGLWIGISADRSATLYRRDKVIGALPAASRWILRPPK